MRRNETAIMLAIALMIGSCALSSRTDQSAGPGAKNQQGTSEIGTAEIGHDLEIKLKAALAQIESMRINASMNGDVDAALARIEAKIELRLQKIDTMIQGAVGTINALGDVSTRNTTVYGANGWQMLGLALVVALYFLIDKIYDARAAEKSVAKIAKVVAQT